jgi:uncharacterized protein YjbJ (UPF0337 family)
VRLVPYIDYQNVGGLVDKVVGLGREIAGVAFDNDRLVKAGEAQQGKGGERLKQLRAEAKARAHHEQATTHERTQREVQNGQRKNREAAGSRS